MARRNRAEMVVADEVVVNTLRPAGHPRGLRLRRRSPPGSFRCNRAIPYRAPGLAEIDQAWRSSYGKVNEVFEWPDEARPQVISRPGSHPARRTRRGPRRTG